MAIQTIIRRSFSRATPLISRLIGAPRTIHTATAFSAVKHVTLSPHFSRAAVFSDCRRFCSSTVDDDIYSDKKLVEIFQSEIEVAEESEDQGKTVAAPSELPFSIEDNPGEQEVTLTREYDGETITVQVSMPNLVTGEEDQGGDSDDDEDPRTDSRLPLLVTVTKKDGNAPSLEFDCTAFLDEIRITAFHSGIPKLKINLLMKDLISLIWTTICRRHSTNIWRSGV